MFIIAIITVFVPNKTFNDSVRSILFRNSFKIHKIKT